MPPLGLLVLLFLGGVGTRAVLADRGSVDRDPAAVAAPSAIAPQRGEPPAELLLKHRQLATGDTSSAGALQHPVAEATTELVDASVPSAAAEKQVSAAVNEASTPGFNPLKIGVDLTLPESLVSVEQGANYVLATTGYSLVVPSNDPYRYERVLQRQIAASARLTGLMTIESALLILAGDDTRLVVDHLHKRVMLEPAQ